MQNENIHVLKKYWLEYRLGDMVLSKFERLKNGTAKKHFQIYPHSLASRYMQLTENERDLDVLIPLIEQYPISEIPEPEEIVVHLRIENVLKNSEYSVKDFLSKERYYKNNFLYVFPRSYYQNIIKKIPSRLKKITIIAGGNKSYDEKKDKEYIDAIRDIFISAGFVVNIREYQLPDEDFVYMCQVKYFIPGGGGFSKLIKNIVQEKNGIVFTNEKTLELWTKRVKKSIRKPLKIFSQMLKKVV